MRLLQSLSFRLALLYVGLFCASVSILLGLYYWLSIERPRDAVKAHVEREAAQMADVYAAGGNKALAAALAARAASPAERKAFHAFFDNGGTLVTANLPSWPSGTSLGWIEIEADVYHDGDETDHNALTLDQPLPDGARLLIGRDTEDIADLEEQLAEMAAWIIGCTLLLGIVGGVLMSRAIRARLDGISIAARSVIAGDLSGRMTVRGSGDDFDRLAETLNLMLERIEELFEAVRRVSDSIAHELRLPLTRLMVTLDSLRNEGADNPEHAARIDDALGEGQRLQRIFDAVLRIARIESGRHAAAGSRVDVAKLVTDVAEFYAVDAEGRSITLTVKVAPGVEITGDPDLLFQAIANLVDNALKNTPAGGEVTVETASDDLGQARVLVADNGRGVCPSDLSRLTERFFRAAPATHEGEGLGLSLVAAIAAHHDADLRFENNDPGLRVELVFRAPK